MKRFSTSLAINCFSKKKKFKYFFSLTRYAKIKLRMDKAEGIQAPRYINEV